MNRCERGWSRAAWRRPRATIEVTSRRRWWPSSSWPLQLEDVRGVQAARDAAQVQGDRRVANNPLVVDPRVGGDDHGDVVRGGLRRDAAQAELRERRHEGVVV